MQNEYPKISIITVCRNVGKQLLDTIQTVQSQRYPNLEYIVIDGASTDDTVKVIESSLEHIEKWISEPDKGIYDAMNKGLKMATGEWVCFMNVGDSFADANVLLDIFGNEAINDTIKVIGGHTNLVYPDRVDVLKAAGARNTPYGLPYCHQSSFIRINDKSNPWVFDTKYRYAADYNVFYHIYDTHGEEAFLTLDRTIANYKMEDSTTFNNIRNAKKEYLKIQSAHIHRAWIKECVKYVLKR